jgi:hypothetical protein
MIQGVRSREVGDAFAPIARPHWGQNRAPALSVPPQPGQEAPSRAAPQWEQNFPTTGEPHAPQGTTSPLVIATIRTYGEGRSEDL